LESVSTSVTVEAPPPGVGLAKASASVDFHLDGTVAENMPQRNAVYLARLAPLTVQRPGGVLAATGQHNYWNSFTVDGLEHTARLPDTAPASRFLPESIGELHVKSIAYSAEFGRNSGAHISAITRGGTNRLHAEAWDYFNGNFLNSRSLSDKTAHIESDRYVEHEAGGSAGGPLKKDRTFFFGLVATDRKRTGPSVRSASSINIPTPEGYAALERVPLAAGQTLESRQAVLNTLSFLQDVYPQIKAFTPAPPANING